MPGKKLGHHIAGTGIISKALSDYGSQVRASDLNEPQLERIRQTAPAITTTRIVSADYVIHGFMKSMPCNLVVARKNSDFEHNQSLQHRIALLQKSFKIRFLSNLP